MSSAGAIVGFVWVAGRPEGYDEQIAELLEAVAKLAARRLQDVAAGERRLAEAQVQADIAARLQRQLLPQEPAGAGGS